MIINIIDRVPEFNFEIFENLNRLEDNEIKFVRSKTGVLSLNRIESLSQYEKDILIKFIRQVEPYLGINKQEEYNRIRAACNLNEKRKLDIP